MACISKFKDLQGNWKFPKPGTLYRQITSVGSNVYNDPKLNYVNNVIDILRQNECAILLEFGIEFASNTEHKSLYLTKSGAIGYIWSFDLAELKNYHVLF